MSRASLPVIRTERLLLSELTLDDADFIVELLNEPAFVQYIGDKGVRTQEEARDYLRQGPLDSYDRHGFGIMLTTTGDACTPLGICGLVKREEFDDPDLGFAFLRRYWSRGYAYEAAAAVLEHANTTLGLCRVIAMADPENTKSIRVLEKLGMRFERKVVMPGETGEIGLYAIGI